MRLMKTFVKLSFLCMFVSSCQQFDSASYKTEKFFYDVGSTLSILSGGDKFEYPDDLKKQMEQDKQQVEAAKKEAEVHRELANEAKKRELEAEAELATLKNVNERKLKEEELERVRNETENQELNVAIKQTKLVEIQHKASQAEEDRLAQIEKKALEENDKQSVEEINKAKRQAEKRSEDLKEEVKKSKQVEINKKKKYETITF